MSRVTDVRFVGYGVKDFAAERKFYAENWGLVEVSGDEEAAWFKTHVDDEHHVLRLHRSDTNSVEVIAFAPADRAAVDVLGARVAAAGCRIVHAPQDLAAPGGGYGV